MPFALYGVALLPIVLLGGGELLRMVSLCLACGERFRDIEHGVPQPCVITFCSSWSVGTAESSGWIASEATGSFGAGAGAGASGCCFSSASNLLPRSVLGS